MQLGCRQSIVGNLLVASAIAVSMSSCAGGNSNRDGTPAQNPISVHLPISTVELNPGAGPVTIPIQIDSPSETALVTVNGFPAGVGVTYSASDTNPSGTLTFAANSSAMQSSQMPTVTVFSSGQKVSTMFTLVVK
jgi:hypothetical protein